MSNELIEAQSNLPGIWECETSLKDIKEIYGKNLSPLEFKVLVSLGKATGLNPYLRELWAVKYGDAPAAIFIGRDGYRRSAQFDSNYDYHAVHSVYSNDTYEVIDGIVSHKYNLGNRGNLVGAYCDVKRKNSTRVHSVFVNFKEYNTNKSEWAKKPETMIKKVAEAQALRMAFQALFSNTYDASEQGYFEQGNQESISNAQNANNLLNINTNQYVNYDDVFYVCENIEHLRQSFDEAKSKTKDPKMLAALVKAKDKRKSELESIEVKVEVTQTNDEWLADFDGNEKETTDVKTV